MRLLMAIGDSTHAQPVLDLGLHLLRTSQSSRTATVLTVVSGNSHQPQAERLLVQAQDRLKAEGVAIQTKTRPGKPSDEIVAEAIESAYDLIVVGEWQASSLMARLRGSTTAQVVEQAPCPVIIAKGKIEPIKRILLCDSGAENPSLLNRFSAQLSKLATGQIEITVLHVMSQITAGPGVPGHQLRAEAQELIAEQAFEGEILAEDVRLLNGLNLTPQPKIRHGFVVEEIGEEARLGDYDLVVIGAYRGGGWQRFLLDNLAQQIIEQVDQPVLVLR
jgi:nucleotide-binding universal stress UspA family protein